MAVNNLHSPGLQALPQGPPMMMEMLVEEDHDGEGEGSSGLGHDGRRGEGALPKDIIMVEGTEEAVPGQSGLVRSPATPQKKDHHTVDRVRQRLVYDPLLHDIGTTLRPHPTTTSSALLLRV